MRICRARGTPNHPACGAKCRDGMHPKSATPSPHLVAHATRAVFFHAARGPAWHAERVGRS